MGGGKGWGGGEAKAPQVKTRGPEFLSCPQMVPTIQGTSFQSRVEFQVDNAQLVRSTGVKVSVMALQGRKSSPQKSRPLESGHRRHAVWIAIEYSYKLSQKSEFKFWCELGWFLQRQSQIFYLMLFFCTLSIITWAFFSLF